LIARMDQDLSGSLNLRRTPENFMLETSRSLGT
jgi:hypothetical protein